MRSFAERKGIGAIVVVACLAFIILTGGVLYYLFVWNPAQQAKISGPTVFYGTVSATVRENNYLDMGTTPTTTSDVYKFYHSYGKDIGAISQNDLLGGTTMTVGTAGSIGVNREDNGILFFLAYPGTDYFLDIKHTLEANSQRFKEYRYVDYDNDNRLEALYKVDFTDISKPDPQTNPPFDVNVQVLQEDTSLALSAPDDQLAIGTGTKTGTIEWTITGLSEKYAAGLARLYISSNETTFGSYVKITGLSIGYEIGTFTGGSITPDTGAKTYWVNIGVSDYRELVYVEEKTLLLHAGGGISYVAVTASFESYFTALDLTQAVNLTLTLETIGANEAVDTAITDTFKMSG